jgi:hypothetical protein
MTHSYHAEPSEPKACSGPSFWARLGPLLPQAELNSGQATKSSGQPKARPDIQPYSSSLTPRACLKKATSPR